MRRLVFFAERTQLASTIIMRVETVFPHHAYDIARHGLKKPRLSV